MFKDVSMSSDELGFVVNKILRMLNDVDLQELPPIIYQLLLLSTKVTISTVLAVSTSVLLNERYNVLCFKTGNFPDTVHRFFYKF